MPFRATFDCLWCGTPHATRGADDIEGWAQLCPGCVGRAGENGFLRYRLRAALDERGRARDGGRIDEGRLPGAEALPAAESLPAAASSSAAPPDDWYLRRGAFAVDALAEATWAADLDAATLRIDAMPLRGRIVELDAGTGWWSPLLAGRGELWASVGSAADLEAVRRRLVAHGLRAHIHVGPPDLAPASADVVFTAFGFGGLEESRLEALLRSVRAALRPAGSLVAIELARETGGGGARGSAGPHTPEPPAGPPPLDVKALEATIGAARFDSLEVERIGSTFVVARASVASDGTSAGRAG